MLATERGVSPVVGVVLLIGLTVSLAALTAPLVFGTVSEAGERSPSADLAFYYDGAAEPEPDDFGTEPDGADGLLTIALKDGDNLPAGQVEIRANYSGGELTEATGFDDGDTLQPGEQISLWVESGEKVSVIWRSPDRDGGAVLGSYVVRSGTLALPPNAPEPDTGCEYVEANFDGDELTVEDVVVNCDLTQYDIDDLDILRGTVIGEIAANEDITLDDGLTFLGDVRTLDDGEVSLENASTINGDVLVGEDGDDVDLLGGSTVRGDISGGEDTDVTVDENSLVTGDITGGGEEVDIYSSTVRGSITVENESDISLDGSVLQGSIETNDESDIDLTNGSTVGGNIVVGDGESEIDIDEDSIIKGPITAGDEIDLDIDGATVDGPITTGDNSDSVDISGSTIGGGVTVGADADNDDTSFTNTTIEGDVSVGGSLTLDDVTIEGDLDLGGSLTCSNEGAGVDNGESTINGVPCGEYKQAELYVSIDSTNSAVASDDDLTVRTTVTNEGFEDEGEVRLLIDGTQEDSQDVTLEGGESDQIDLEWVDNSKTSGTYNATVATVVDSDETTVYVTDGDGPYLNVTVTDHDEFVLDRETVTVDAMIENIGNDDATDRTIELNNATDGTRLDSTTESVEEGESVNVTFEWEPPIGDEEYELEVNSDDVTKTVDVTVENATYDLQDLDLSAGRTDSEVNVSVDLETNDDNARLEIRGNSTQGSGQLLGEMEVSPAESGLYELALDEKGGKDINDLDFVTVDIFPPGADEREDRIFAEWDG